MQRVVGVRVDVLGEAISHWTTTNTNAIQLSEVERCGRLHRQVFCEPRVHQIFVIGKVIWRNMCRVLWMIRTARASEPIASVHQSLGIAFCIPNRGDNYHSDPKKKKEYEEEYIGTFSFMNTKRIILISIFNVSIRSWFRAWDTSGHSWKRVNRRTEILRGPLKI